MIAALTLYLGLSLLALTAWLAPAQAADRLAGRELVEALRGGGYVLVFRHAITDRSHDDADRQNLENCATQRNLSDEGREQSRTIGREASRLGIPIGAVLASPYCRTLETARLAFGAAESTPDLVSQLAGDAPDSRERLTAALRALLSLPPSPGTNTVLVTHVLNIEDAIGLDPDEGEAVVVRPDGAGGFSVVARIPASDWATLDAAAEASP